MPEKSVTQTNCDARHMSLRWALGITIAIIGTSVWAGWDAQRKVEVHTSAAKEQNKAINEKLDDMKDMQSRILDEVFMANGKR